MAHHSPTTGYEQTIVAHHSPVHFHYLELVGSDDVGDGQTGVVLVPPDLLEQAGSVASLASQANPVDIGGSQSARFHDFRLYR